MPVVCLVGVYPTIPQSKNAQWKMINIWHFFHWNALWFWSSLPLNVATFLWLYSFNIEFLHWKLWNFSLKFGLLRNTQNLEKIFLMLWTFSKFKAWGRLRRFLCASQKVRTLNFGFQISRMTSSKITNGNFT